MKARALASVALAFSLAGCLLLDPWDAVSREPSEIGEAGPSGDGPTNDDGSTDDVSSPVDAGVDRRLPPTIQPSTWLYDRAAWLGACVGTRVAPRFVLTALGCTSPSDGGAPAVTFYLTGPGPDPAQTAHVIAITTPPGTNTATLDRTASNGDFADLALLELDHDTPGAATAPMDWTYPGAGALGYKLGVERLNDSDKFGVLRTFQDNTDTNQDGTGAFRTKYPYTDRGSPFYVAARRMIGVLSPPDDVAARFTSVPHHLPWVLDGIGYRWPSIPAVIGRTFTGAPYQNFTGTERVCQYACNVVSECLAYDYTAATSQCTLLKTITGVVTAPSVRSAPRWALRRGGVRSGDPVGFVRADGTSAAFHRLSAGGLGALNATTTTPFWAPASITTAPAGRPSVYVRSDGIDAATYRDTSTGHVVELAFGGGTWNETDLTTSCGAPIAAGDPVAYLRSDGVSAIVYRGTDSHIIEAKFLGGWSYRDLTITTGTLAASDLAPFVRADHYSSIMFRGYDGHVYEVYESDGGSIGYGDPFGLADAGVAAVGTPHAYVRHDAQNAVVYRGADGTVNEIALSTIANWAHKTLDTQGVLAAGNPMGYVRSDGYSAVVFRSTTNHIIEIALGGTTSWTSTDLTDGGGATIVGDPAPYVRADGVDAVLFRTSDNHVHELTHTTAGWTLADLSAVAGETP